MAKREANEQAALDALAKAPDGLTTTQLGAILWPGKAKTHLPAGRVLGPMSRAGLVTRNEAGVIQITTAGADQLADLLEKAATV